jgi:HSP20 family protein
MVIIMRGLIPFSSNQPDLFNTTFDDFYNMLDDFFADGRMLRRNLQKSTFRVDVKDNGKDFAVACDLPGVKRDEINVSVNEGTLSVTVNRNEEKEDKNENYVHRERRCSSMSRSIYLGDIDSSGISAKLEDGVLSITVPKKATVDNTVNIQIQ